MDGAGDRVWRIVQPEEAHDAADHPTAPGSRSGRVGSLPEGVEHLVSEGARLGPERVDHLFPEDARLGAAECDAWESQCGILRGVRLPLPHPHRHRFGGHLGNGPVPENREGDSCPDGGCLQTCASCFVTFAGSAVFITGSVTHGARAGMLSSPRKRKDGPKPCDCIRRSGSPIPR